MAMKGRLSRFALLALIAITLAVRTSFPQRQVLTWDVFGYYLYLRRPSSTMISD